MRSNSLASPVKAEFEAVRKTKVYEEVARQIERLIADGRFKPGDKLPAERELAETLEVSRSSVRDAIRTLELLGLVEPGQGEGTVAGAQAGAGGGAAGRAQDDRAAAGGARGHPRFR